MMVSIEDIKNIYKEMVETNFVSNLDISEEQRNLSPKIGELSLSMISEIKISNPNYTVRKSLEIKKYQVSEDGEDEPSYALIEYLKGNSEVFYEIVGYLFFGKRGKYKTENQLFYINLYSRYFGNYQDIFFVSKSGEFWIVTDRKTEMLFTDYISKYFCELTEGDAERIERLLVDKTRNHDSIQQELTIISKELSSGAIKMRGSFNSGAITFMDFLGWKGIWNGDNKENHIEKVSELIKDIRDVIDCYTEELFEHKFDFRISKLISISDTIAIFTPEVKGVDRIKLLELHARIAKYILEKSVASGYPIRGAISFGEYNTSDNIMMGPGIDECASWHEVSNWIGVHFTPKAELIIEIQGAGHANGICDYNVPVKRGYPQPHYCVIWEIDDEMFLSMVEKVKAMLPEISEKYTKTYEYLKERGMKNGKRENGLG